jgi:hypothetical protein
MPRKGSCFYSVSELKRLWAAGKLKKFGTEDSAGPQDEGF